MAIGKLDHYSIRTTDLAATRRFYTEVLGFQEGPRPPFKFPGVWLYQDGAALVHVIGVDLHGDNAGLRDYLGDASAEAGLGSGAIDHLAFTASELDRMRERFRSDDVAFRERSVPSMQLHQIFLADPNGVTIELNFPT